MRLNKKDFSLETKKRGWVEYKKISLPLTKSGPTPYGYEEITKSHPLNDFGLELETMHATDFYFVAWTKRGHCDFQSDLTNIHLGDNTLLFIRPGQYHTIKNLSKIEGVAFCFGEGFFDSLQTRTAQNIKFRLFSGSLNHLKITKKKTTTKLDDIAKTLVSMMNSKDKDARQKTAIYSLLGSFLLTITTTPEYRATDRGSIEITPHWETCFHFMELVENHYKTRHLVSDYLADLNVSHKQLAICLDENVGNTPLDVINDRLLLEAKRLLLYTNMMVKDISKKIGFRDATHFVKHFKKNIGITPIKYRKNTVIPTLDDEQPN